jgi:multidrug efflux system membrane fusion protein
MKAYHPILRLIVLAPLIAGALALFSVGCATKKAGRGGAFAAPVVVEQALSMDVPVELRQIGTVEAINTVAITARVGGQLVRVGFTEGRNVRKGEVLFQIDPAPYRAALAQARANLERDKAALSNASADVARYRDLVQKDYVTRQTYDAAVSTAAETKAMVDADSAAAQTASLNLAYCTIAAPITGRTGPLLVKQGNLVVANGATPLVTINQIEPIYVSFAIPEQQLSEVRARRRQGELPVTTYLPSDSTKMFQGSLTFVDNTVDPTTGTVLLKASFANAEGVLWPGLYVKVALVLTTIRNATVVPAAAVQTSQQGNFVYVVAPGDTAQLRPIEMGPSYLQWVVVDKGVASGEKVVTDGQLGIRQGMRVMVKTGLMSAAAGGGRHQ